MEFLIKKSKLLYIIYGVLCFALLVSAIIYMTQYANIRVLTVISNGETVLSQADINKYFMDFYANNNLPNVEKDMWTIYDFQQSLNDFNYLILYFGCAALVLFAVIMIVGNQSREVYYLSNLIVGTAVPGVVSILCIVLMVINSGFYGQINANFDLFNRASLLIDEKVGAVHSQYTPDKLTPLYNVDTLTLTLFNVFFAIILVASLAICAYAIYRYVASSEKRKQIIARAVSENE